MQIPRSYIENYSKALNVVSDRARAQLVDALSKIDYSADVADVRNAVIAIMQPACGASSTMAARLAADFYDGLRARFGIDDGFMADVEDMRDPEATEGAVRAFAQDLVDEKPVDQFVGKCADRIDYETRKAANECVAFNARRDPKKPKWARIPTGVETCQFCIMLASRGFVYHSEETASHAHAHCDCRVIPSWDKSPTAQGYDPDKYYDMWKHPENYTSGGSNNAGNNASRPPGEQDVLKQFKIKSTNDVDDLAAVNPHYNDGFEWQNNCQRCVVAYELRMRGYDVTAKPYAKDSIDDDGTVCWVYDRNAWALDTDFRWTKKTTFKTDIEGAFNQWGDGARGIIRVKWNGGSGHFFSVRRENGQLVYEDPQSGAVRDIDQTLKACSKSKYQLWFLRVDNRELTDLVKEAVENA